MKARPPSEQASSLALYIHWPFCKSKCPYCDFNSHVADTINQADWREAYKRELRSAAAETQGRRITSIFFGGGTPSLMEVESVETILNEVARLWDVDVDVEITLEANPTSVEAEKFAGFRAAGVNRVSLGVQALEDTALKFLGRAHNSDEARQAIELATKHFPRFSFDLIYARREQTLQAWENELREALKMTGGHLSLYQLTIEPNTVFHTLWRKGEALTASDDTAVSMYELTQAIMDEVGLPAYEISNHARAGHESRHNLTYWHYGDYLGIGPGAHGRMLREERFFFATENHRAPDSWLQQVREKGHGLKDVQPLTRATAQREALMMGMRLTTGISLESWRAKFGAELIGEFLAPEKIMRLKEENYIADNGTTLFATREGRQRLNAVLGYLMDAHIG